ncbi:hypothetical protein ALP73_200033 [Pseudomonas coronafaciens pv. garcae]|nr:hypothetical protein ALP73_200033 [Pseudomonas coronafaciens pv. garcae]RMW11965.1 hypothetical protein ALO99_200169 [Pseudomonas coronafaciens pv. porri]
MSGLSVQGVQLPSSDFIPQHTIDTGGKWRKVIILTFMIFLLALLDLLLWVSGLAFLLSLFNKFWRAAYALQD